MKKFGSYANHSDKLILEKNVNGKYISAQMPQFIHLYIGRHRFNTLRVYEQKRLFGLPIQYSRLSFSLETEIFFFSLLRNLRHVPPAKPEKWPLGGFLFITLTWPDWCWCYRLWWNCRLQLFCSWKQNTRQYGCCLEW